VPWPHKLLELEFRQLNRLPAPINRGRQLPASPRTATADPLLPELPSATASNHHRLQLLAAEELPPQSVPDQGKRRNRLPMSPSSFCPTSWPSPRTRSPASAATSPAGRSVKPPSLWIGGRRRAILPRAPCPLSFLPEPPFSLFPSHLFLQIIY
jgi:hypothetical protein